MKLNIKAKDEEVEKKSVAKPAAKKGPAQKAKPIEAGPSQSRPKASLVGFSYEAIKQPHISEKASYLAEKDQYIFEISPNYNKKELTMTFGGRNMDNLILYPGKCTYFLNNKHMFPLISVYYSEIHVNETL